MISVRCGESSTPFVIKQGRFKFTLREAQTRNCIMEALSHGKMTIAEISEHTGLEVLAIRREIPRMREYGFVDKERINYGKLGSRYEWGLV